MDAYERELVKRMEVASLMVDNGFNRPSVKLLETRNRNNRFSARVKLAADVRASSGAKSAPCTTGTT